MTDYQHKMNEVSWKRYLEVLAETGLHSAACKAIGVDRSRPTIYRHKDPKREEEWQAAQAIAHQVRLDRYEEEADRRAVKGTLKPVYQMGKKVGQVKEFSDRLLELLLKKHDPSYREKSSVEITGNAEEPVRIIEVGVLPALPEPEDK